ncbi:unnamed protein product, partial [Effrenium voratum]
ENASSPPHQHPAGATGFFRFVTEENWFAQLAGAKAWARRPRVIRRRSFTPSRASPHRASGGGK